MGTTSHVMDEISREESEAASGRQTDGVRQGEEIKASPKAGTGHWTGKFDRGGSIARHAPKKVI